MYAALALLLLVDHKIVQQTLEVKTQLYYYIYI